MEGRCITYQIDNSDKIIWISRNWSSFARENKGQNLERWKILGRPYYRYIEGDTSKHVYSVLIDRVRKEGLNIRFSYRCDSPDKRRFMSMFLSPLTRHRVLAYSCVESEEEREPILLLDQDIFRSDEIVVMCSWCKKIRLDRAHWVTTEKAVERLRLFERVAQPQIAHDICPHCYDRVLKSYQTHHEEAVVDRQDS